MGMDQQTKPAPEGKATETVRDDAGITDKKTGRLSRVMQSLAETMKRQILGDERAHKKINSLTVPQIVAAIEEVETHFLQRRAAIMSEPRCFLIEFISAVFSFLFVYLIVKPIQLLSCGKCVFVTGNKSIQKLYAPMDVIPVEKAELLSIEKVAEEPTPTKWYRYLPMPFKLTYFFFDATFIAAFRFGDWMLMRIPILNCLYRVVKWLIKLIFTCVLKTLCSCCPKLRKKKVYIKVTMKDKSKGCCYPKKLTMYFPEASEQSVYRIFRHDINASTENPFPFWRRYLESLDGKQKNVSNAGKKASNVEWTICEGVEEEKKPQFCQEDWLDDNCQAMQCCQEDWWDDDCQAMLDAANQAFATSFTADADSSQNIDPTLRKTSDPTDRFPDFVKKLFKPIVDVFKAYIRPKNKLEKLYTARFAVQGSFDRPSDPDNAFTVYLTPFGPKKAHAGCTKRTGVYMCFDDPAIFSKWTKYTGQGRSSYTKTNGGEREDCREKCKACPPQREDRNMRTCEKCKACPPPQREDRNMRTCKGCKADSRRMVAGVYIDEGKKVAKFMLKLSFRFLSNSIFSGCDLFLGDLLCTILDLDLPSIKLPGLPSFDTIPNFDFQAFGAQFGRLIAMDLGVDIDWELPGVHVNVPEVPQFDLPFDLDVGIDVPDLPEIEEQGDNNSKTGKGRDAVLDSANETAGRQGENKSKTGKGRDAVLDSANETAGRQAATQTQTHVNEKV